MRAPRVAGESLDTADLIAVAIDGADANAQVFQVRDGVLAERHGFYLDNEGERDEGEVTEEFVAQYYSAAPAVPRLVVVGPGAARARRAARRGAVEPPRRPGRGARRRARRQAPAARARRAQRPARAGPGQAAAASAAASSASTRWPRCSEALDLESLPVRIEGFDISNLGPSTPSPRWSCSRAGRRRRPTTAASRSAAIERDAARRFRLGGGGPRRGALARYSSRRDRSPHDAERDEAFAALPDLILIDGGKGQLSAGMRALGPLVERGTAVIGLAKRIEEVFVPGRSDPVPVPPDSEALACCSGCATRRTASRSTSTGSAGARR